VEGTSGIVVCVGRACVPPPSCETPNLTQRARLRSPPPFLFSSTSTDPPALLATALRLQQAADVLAWCGQAGIGDASRYGSPGEWGSALVRRRQGGSGDAAGAGRPPALFVDALRGEAAPGAPDYPPPGAATPRAAIPALFLGGRASCDGRRACLALFGYALADAAGGGVGGAAGTHLAALGARFGLPSPALAQWRLGALLDEAGAGGPAADAALDAAVGTVPAAAAPDAPWRLGAALSAAGRPDAGLALLRARGAVGAATTLEEAVAGLDARLACGLLAEGYGGARAYWEAQARAGGAAAASAEAAAALLTTRLAAKAAAAGDLAAVCLLPLAAVEEAALAAWLLKKGQEGPGGRGGQEGALALTLFHLQRGRVPEAAAAAGGGLPATSAGQAALDLVRAAACALPLGQRALVVVRRGGGGGEGGGGPDAPVTLLPAGAPLPADWRPLVPAGLTEDAPGLRVVVVQGDGGAAAAPLTTSTGADPWVEGGGKGGDAGPPPAAPPALRAPVSVTAAAAAPAWRAGRGEAGFLNPPALEVGGGGRGKRARIVWKG